MGGQGFGEEKCGGTGVQRRFGQKQGRGDRGLEPKGGGDRGSGGRGLGRAT